MSATPLGHSKMAIRRAGQALAGDASLAPRDEEAAIVVLEDWRVAHGEALNAAQRGLRSRLRTIGLQGAVSQRLKRRRSIIAKLRHESTMKLDTMRDIAGCRAVVDGGVEAVRAVAQQWRRTARSRVRRLRDYIATPQSTGYRAVHLEVLYGDRFVEVQVRTPAQHAWAVAVEDVASRTGHDLKRGIGPDEILESLRELSRSIADVEERGASISQLDLTAVVNMLSR